MDALADKPGVEVVRCGETTADMVELMAILHARGVRTLIVEGGSRLLHSLFEADLVSQIIIKHIPVISGALDAPTYLQAGDAGSTLGLSRWRLDDMFVKGGVGVSIYRPLAEAAAA